GGVDALVLRVGVVLVFVFVFVVVIVLIGQGGGGQGGAGDEGEGRKSGAASEVLSQHEESLGSNSVWAASAMRARPVHADAVRNKADAAWPRMGSGDGDDGEGTRHGASGRNERRRRARQVAQVHALAALRQRGMGVQHMAQREWG